MNNLKNLIELAHNATPGAWKGFDRSKNLVICQEKNFIADGVRPCDAAFIAAANPEAILELAKQLEALTAFQGVLAAELGFDPEDPLLRVKILERVASLAKERQKPRQGQLIQDDKSHEARCENRADFLEKECAWLSQSLAHFIKPVTAETCRKYAREAVEGRNSDG